jgi:hypothetical protein
MTAHATHCLRGGRAALRHLRNFERFISFHVYRSGLAPLARLTRRC